MLVVGPSYVRTPNFHAYNSQLINSTISKTLFRAGTLGHIVMVVASEDLRTAQSQGRHCISMI
jgi:hypothetical protein